MEKATILLTLPKEERQKLKVWCAQNDTTQQEVIRKLIKNHNRGDSSISGSE